MIYSKLHLKVILSFPIRATHYASIVYKNIDSRLLRQNLSLMEANDARSRSLNFGLKCTFSFLLKPRLKLLICLSACSPLSTFQQATIIFAFLLARSIAVSFPIPVLAPV